MLERGSDLKNLFHARAHGPAAHQDDDVAGLDALRSMALDSSDSGDLGVEHARRSDFSHQSSMRPRVSPLAVRTSSSSKPARRRCNMTSGTPPARNTWTVGC